MAGRTGTRLVAWMLALIVVFGLSSARADESLYVSNAYSTGIVMDVSGVKTALAGGSIGSPTDPSKLGGVVLPFLYCVDIPNDVYVGETYKDTIVDNYGDVNWAPLGGGVNSGAFTQLSTSVVEGVAWLLDNYGVGGQGDDAMALQAAIWNVVYGVTLDETGTNDATMVSDYHRDLRALPSAATLASAPPPPVLWLSPNPPSNGLSIEQGLVTKVPEPSSILLLGIFAAGVLGLRRKLA